MYRGTLLGIVALTATLLAAPANAQRSEDREQLRKELIQQLDHKLKRIRQQLIKEIDRKLGRAPRKVKKAPRRSSSTAKPFLGIAIKELRPGLRELLGIPGKRGVLVDRVADGSSADKAGIRRTDVIVSWSGKAVTGKEQLIGLIRSHKVGDRIEVVLYRRGRKKEITVTLSARPSEQDLERQSHQPRRGSRPDGGEKDLEQFLDKALKNQRKKKNGSRQPGMNNPDMKKMLEQMMGPGGNERMQKMMEQFFGKGKGGDMQEMLKRGMKMYEEMMKNPDSRKQMEEMMKQMFGGGGKGGPNQKQLQKYLERMMNPGGSQQPGKSTKKPGKQGDKKRIQKMLDDLLGEGKGKQKKSTDKPRSTGKRGYLGVGLTPMTETLRHQLSLPEGVGVLVTQVVKGSPAAQAGLKQYDVILKISGKGIGSLADVREALSSRGPGSKLTIQIVRGGKKRSVKVTLTQPRKQEFK